MTTPLEIAPGDGLIVRRGPLILVIGHASDDARGRVLGLVEELEGEAFLSGLEAAVIELADGAPGALAAAVIDDEHRECLVVGHARIVGTTSEGAETIGAGSTPMRTALSPAAAHIRLEIAPGPRALAGSDLVAGTVPGSAAELALDPLAVAAPPPRTPEPAPAPPESLSVVPLSAASLPPDALRGLRPLPVGEEEAPETPPARTPEHSGEALVKGVRCPRDHHNSPDARFCHRCGIRMGAHRSLVIVDGPRPPLGVLVLDDGGTFPLASDSVIGREPTADNLVMEGTAEPLAIEDPERLASRAHALLRLEGWDVLLEDRASANGTWLRAGGEPWRRLGPNEQVTLSSGTRLKIGGRELLFEHHHR